MGNLEFDNMFKIKMTAWVHQYFQVVFKVVDYPL